VRLEDLNHLDTDAAIDRLLRCCGSTRWAQRVAAARPFANVEQLVATADTVWTSLDRSDWLEAFAAHPRIGERPVSSGAGKAGRAGEARRAGETGGASRAGGAEWAEQEQAGTRLANDEQRERLVAQNREYEARFGHIFIVCAAGKSAGEMLALLTERLTNQPAQELRIAAEEQRKITRLRLAKLLAGER
jgi:OHCU decarboxylase